MINVSVLRRAGFLICLFGLNVFAAKAQLKKLDGVYVGAQLYSTPFDGMQITNIAIYFRNDGTFTDKLNDPGWRTKVSGSYTINSNMVHLAFSNGDESKKYKLTESGVLQSTAGITHSLHKVRKTTTLPAAGYERKAASGRGGTGTGMPAVSAFSSDLLYFDGKGNFSLDHSGVIGMGGDVTGGTIGGKFDMNGKAKSGTYALGDGEITLRFKNGTVAKHSFFFSPPNEEDLIVLDGEFYFREEEKSSVGGQATEVADNKSNSKESPDLPTSPDLLNKLRDNYGGANIDKIMTIKETLAITGGLEAVVLTDLTNDKIRAEVRQKGQLLLVRQMEGNKGWQWRDGTKNPLPQNEIRELKLSLYQGTLGLHTKLNKYFQKGSVTRSGDDYMITFYIDQNKLVYLVGRDYSLKASAYSNNEVPNFSLYRGFTKTNGITYPSITESSEGKNTITATTTQIEFNPVLTDESWKTP